MTLTTLELGFALTAGNDGECVAAGEYSLGFHDWWWLSSGRWIGDLQLRHDPTGSILWMPKPRNTAAASAWLDRSGNFSLVGPPPEGVPYGPSLWSTATSNQHVERLVVQETGRVALLTADGATVWANASASGLDRFRSVTGDTMLPGDLLVDGRPPLTNGDYSLAFISGTGLVLQGPAGAITQFGRPDPRVWAAGLDNTRNFVVYANCGAPTLFTAVWSSGIDGGAVAKLMLHEGYIALYDSDGAEVWRS